MVVVVADVLLALAVAVVALSLPLLLLLLLLLMLPLGRDILENTFSLSRVLFGTASWWGREVMRPLLPSSRRRRVPPGFAARNKPELFRGVPAICIVLDRGLCAVGKGDDVRFGRWRWGKSVSWCLSDGGTNDEGCQVIMSIKRV